MQQPPMRASQNDSVKRTSNMVQQQQSKSQEAQRQQQVDTSPQESVKTNWNAGASRVILWICKGWWNSASWWLCFASGLLIWCLVYAKDEDGGEFAGTLYFCMYFIRVSFFAHSSDSFFSLQLSPGKKGAQTKVLRQACRPQVLMQSC